MKNILIIILVFSSFSVVAQYTHFNETYIDQMSPSLGIIVEEADSSLLAIGVGGIYPNLGQYTSKVNSFGTLLENDFLPTPGIGFGGGPQNDSKIKTSDGYILRSLSGQQFEGWNYYVPGIAKFNSELEIIWHQQFSTWNTLGESFFYPGPFCKYDEETFCMLSEGIYNEENIGFPDSISWRITRLSKANGSILEDNVYVYGPYSINMHQIRKVGDNFFILLTHSGEFGTTESIDGQTMLIKTNNQGVPIDQIELGNPNYCWESYAQMELTADNKIILFYDMCLEQEELSINDWRQKTEVHHVLVDPETMTMSNDVTFDFPYAGEWLNWIHFIAVIVDDQNNYLSLGALDLDDNMEYDHWNIITKFTPAGDIIWQQEYFSDQFGVGNFYQEFLSDIIQTSDGGYAATGTTRGATIDQRHWLLKIDACGYEQPSGCPPTVGVEENVRHTEPVEVWPNPFHHQLKAVLPQNAQRVFISDAMGRIVFEENVFYPNQTWNLGWLSDGVYVMNVQLENGQKIAQRIVKQ